MKTSIEDVTYYGVFKEDSGQISYTIPDLPRAYGCGKTLEEAIEDAKHLIALELSVIKKRPTASSSEEIKNNNPKSSVIKINVPEEILSLNK